MAKTRPAQGREQDDSRTWTLRADRPAVQGATMMDPRAEFVVIAVSLLLFAYLAGVAVELLT
jgi:hypothetical protein